MQPGTQALSSEAQRPILHDRDQRVWLRGDGRGRARDCLAALCASLDHGTLELDRANWPRSLGAYWVRKRKLRAGAADWLTNALRQ